MYPVIFINQPLKSTHHIIVKEAPYLAKMIPVRNDSETYHFVGMPLVTKKIKLYEKPF